MRLLRTVTHVGFPGGLKTFKFCHVNCFVMFMPDIELQKSLFLYLKQLSKWWGPTASNW